VKIRSKVGALLAVMFAILGAAALLVAQYVIMPSFAQLERADATTAMRRVNYALDVAVDRLAVSSVDWGNWADTFQYMLDHNRTFVDLNLTPIGLRQLRINLLMIVDLKGNIVRANQLDLEAEQHPLDLDLAARKSLPADFPWRANLAEGRAAKGLLRTNRGTLLVAGSPVLDGEGHGPSRGMVILGRLLTDSVIRDISSQAQTPLLLLGPSANPGGEQLLESALYTRVYRSFNDIYGRPVMTLRVDLPREVTHRGYSAARYAGAYLAGAALAVLVLLVATLNRLVLAPLAAVTRHAVAVGKDQDLTTRLDLTSNDEIGVLAREFDRMVTRVAESRTQLVDQSYQAGLGELAKGVLHNLGNAMTPIGVRLANLAERLRHAPVEDAGEALAELRRGSERGSEDPARQADLEEFVRLACQELAGTIVAAREDVEVMTRQATAVQTALAEQRRTAHNEYVIEPVRLTELVAQSLEIVPDSSRQRLAIDADETLRRVGVVRVARTVLRLVLQNLIINAADAIRDAGREKGRLRVSAEIVSEGARRQLRVCCKDDGVGIPAENLERVFEKGFSTKPRETNQGIGLHWCANVINALGGRIWAESDGAGRGAALHFSVPLADAEAAALAGAAALPGAA
jgi:two-component system, NtrC family, sensor kinase